MELWPDSRPESSLVLSLDIVLCLLGVLLLGVLLSLACWRPNSQASTLLWSHPSLPAQNLRLFRLS